MKNFKFQNKEECEQCKYNFIMGMSIMYVANVCLNV